VALLVVVSEDIALVSEQSLYKAFLRAARERPWANLDQVAGVDVWGRRPRLLLPWPS
jgi:hypothetical protein